MKLQQLASKPQLVKIVLDDEATIKQYEEPIEFYVHDRQDMETFLKLATLEGNNDISKIADIVKDLVMDEKGKKIMQDGVLLPPEVIVKVVEKTINNLGNQVAQTGAK